jgi:hypothetical protein
MRANKSANALRYYSDIKILFIASENYAFIRAHRLFQLKEKNVKKKIFILKK